VRQKSLGGPKSEMKSVVEAGEDVWILGRGRDDGCCDIPEFDASMLDAILRILKADSWLQRF
jgi:hypothetical protein